MTVELEVPTTTPAPVPEIDLDSLELDGKALHAQVVAAVETAHIDQTVEGASTFEIVIRDSELAFLQSGILKDQVTVALSGLTFTLASVAKAGRDLTIQFEDQIVAALRGKKGYKKADRAKTTRAEFIFGLLREVKDVPWKFYCPELHKKQPIGAVPATASTNSSAATASRAATAAARRFPGFQFLSAHVTVKGAAANSNQLHTIGDVLQEGFRHNIPEEALVAMVMCITQENDATNNSGGGGGSTGAFQQTPGWPESRLNISREVQSFLFDAPTEPFMKAYARLRGSTSLGHIIQTTQRSAFPDAYDRWHSEAQRTVKTWLNGATASGGGTNTSASFTVATAYTYERKPNEDSWTCIQRLVAEVGWRCFVVGSTVYLIAETDLMRSAPRMEVDDDSPGVDTVDYTYDRGQKVAEATIAGWADLWDAPSGSVVKLKNLGPADGAWLVTTIHRELFRSDVTITLKQPIPKLPEPAPQTTSVSVPGTGGAAGATGGVTFRGVTFTPGIVGIGHALQKLGLTVGENPAFGGVHPGDHASYGYYDHMHGGAIDVGPPKPWFDDLAAFLAAHKTQLGIPTSGVPNLGGKYGTGVLWRVEGHFDHMHISARHGG